MEPLELAARCEAATGLDEGLFWEAWHACYPKPSEVWSVPYAGWTPESPEYTEWQERQMLGAGFIDAEAWLDAALTLVPEGAAWTLQGHGAPGPMAWVDGHDRFVGAATPALALCAAALRARAKEADNAPRA